MPPRHELNERFHGHIRRAERAGAASTAFFATLTVLAIVGGGALAFHDIAPNTFARATAAPKHLASQVAAASSLPWLDGIADAIYRAVCPIFSTCENLASNSATTPANVKPTLPSKSNSYQATTSPNVKQGQQTHPAPAAGGATATQVAVSNQPTVVNQPVLERVIQTVREVQTPGVNAGYVDEKLSLLQNSLLLRMSAMENANATSFRSVSSSVSASAIAGVLGIGSGGTGLSSAPTYGELLLGNSLGGYTLTATSSLGLPTFADITASISSASFGKSWEIASGALAPTTTLGVLVSASSTFSGGVSIDRATTTSATSTSLFSTLGRFTTGIMDAFTAVTGTITNLTSTTLVAMNATTSSLFAGDLAASTAASAAPRPPPSRAAVSSGSGLALRRIMSTSPASSTPTNTPATSRRGIRFCMLRVRILQR